MKLHTGTHTVEKSENFEENRFSIEASAKAFMILSDGLYSNKILAVVRELSTNAYDSHVDAKCVDKPFEVHLPTRIEPYFYVRDFGTSMCHEDCMTLYTTYFRSTRNNSNDSVGCLGLGSKAPFAYTDSFTVEAYFNNVKRIYSAHRDNNGNPTFSLMDTVETNDPNGIKVSMPVKADDMDTFQEEAENVFQYFKVRPTLTGNNEIYYSDEQTLLRSNDNTWEFNTGDHSNKIIMGQIAYPINNDSISSRYSDDDKIGNFLWHSSGLRLYVNIGDVDITPSRESLSYTPETKKNIRNLLNKVINDIKETVEDAIKSQSTLYLARKKFLDIESQCASVKSAMDSLNNAIEWNGQKIFDSMVGNKIKAENMGIKQIHKSGYRSKSETNKDIKEITMNKTIKFYVDNCVRGGMGRIRQDLKENYGSNSYTAYIYVLGADETVDNNRFLDILGNATKDDVVLTESLPKVQRNNSGGGSGSTVDYSEVSYYDQEAASILTDKMSVKVENAVYIPTKKGQCHIQGMVFDITQIANIIGYIHEDLDTDKTFYFLTPSQIKTRKLDERDNWLSENHLFELIKEIGDYYADDINKIKHQDQIGYGYKWKEVFKKTKTNNKAKEIIMEYEEYKSSIDKMSNKCENVFSVCRSFGMNMHSSNPNVNYKARFENPLNKEISKYPMLSGNVLNTLWSDEQQRVVAEYIDIVEENAKLIEA
jgi:hypothetical protein